MTHNYGYTTLNNKLIVLLMEALTVLNWIVDFQLHL